MPTGASTSSVVENQPALTTFERLNMIIPRLTAPIIAWANRHPHVDQYRMQRPFIPPQFMQRPMPMFQRPMMNLNTVQHNTNQSTVHHHHHHHVQSGKGNNVQTTERGHWNRSTRGRGRSDDSQPTRGRGRSDDSQPTRGRGRFDDSFKRGTGRGSHNGNNSSKDSVTGSSADVKNSGASRGGGVHVIARGRGESGRRVNSGNARGRGSGRGGMPRGSAGAARGDRGRGGARGASPARGASRGRGPARGRGGSGDRKSSKPP